MSCISCYQDCSGLPTPFSGSPLLQDPMEVCLQGIQQAQVAASHASPTHLGIAYGRSGLVGVQPAAWLCFAASFYFIF